jgi:hypothetical protein
MIDTNKVAPAAFLPLVKHAMAHRGSIKALAARLTRRTGKTVHRQMVEGWLNPDPDKRTEPLFGMGLVILDEGNALMKADRKVNLPAIIRRAKPDHCERCGGTGEEPGAPVDLTNGKALCSKCGGQG